MDWFGGFNLTLMDSRCNVAVAPYPTEWFLLFSTVGRGTGDQSFLKIKYNPLNS